MNTTVTLILDVAEAEKWKLFQKRYSLFEELERQGIFEIGFGKCVINFAYGEPQNVVKEEIVWKRERVV